VRDSQLEIIIEKRQRKPKKPWKEMKNSKSFLFCQIFFMTLVITASPLL